MPRTAKEITSTSPSVAASTAFNIMDLIILYRGPLSSCNYDCHYCPFAKHQETKDELEVDRRALERLVRWCAERQQDRLSVFFTPWGEALVRRWYQNAFVRLTRLSHIEKVAIQTNLSCRLDWVEACEKSRMGMWVTYHPAQVSRPRFMARCLDLYARGVRFSVGVVGLKEAFDEIAALRRELPGDIYFWVNAYKDQPDYYSSRDIAFLEAIDPMFRTNTQRHPSFGRRCRTGKSVISVDGDGTIRRCHFIKTPLGNIYQKGFEQALYDRPCTNATCGCHIGYVHLEHLGLYEVYGAGVLERVPDGW